MNDKTPLFNKLEITVLAACGSMVVLHAIFWRQLRGHPGISLSLLGLILVLAAGFWFYRNYRLVSVRTKRVKAIEEKLEGIVYSLFFPRGYDLLEPFRVDQQDIGWASLRDSAGIPVSLQYVDTEMTHPVGSDRIQRLIERMNVDNAPKGVSLTTGAYEEEALALARRSNILTRDGRQLVEMVQRAEEEAAGAPTHVCPQCSSKLVESADITGLWRCPNPNCRKEFKIEDLEPSDETHGQKKGPHNVKAFTISCYGCSRPVELDTTMSGLMECPYDDCSWIINVDNELLALRGGLDKRASERLTEIKCPRCERMIKVPADAEGLMECPCEEKWIIDVGAALGERAQAQIAEGGPETEVENRAPAVRQIQALDYTGTVTARPAIEPLPEEETGRLIDRALVRSGRIVAARKMQAATAGANFELARENPALESEPSQDTAPAPDAESTLIDCPGCGAGVPSGLEACPVCGAMLLTIDTHAQPAEAELNVDATPLAAARDVHHRRSFFALSTPALIFFFVFSVLAFLAFVYFITR